MAQEVTTVRVILQDRGDGGLRARSDALIGLVLSGPHKGAVLAKIAPAIQALFRAKGLDVDVRPERPIAEILNGPTPSCLNMHVNEQVYIVELKKAA